MERTRAHTNTHRHTIKCKERYRENTGWQIRRERNQTAKWRTSANKKLKGFGTVLSLCRRHHEATESLPCSSQQEDTVCMHGRNNSNTFPLTHSIPELFICPPFTVQHRFAGTVCKRVFFVRFTLRSFYYKKSNSPAALPDYTHSDYALLKIEY